MQYDDTLTFNTSVDGDGAKKGLDGLDAYFANFAANVSANIVSSISSAFAEIPKQIIAIGSQFESSMAQVAATMGITQTAEEFDILSEKAKEMGESTKFSASQAADALNYLALAGYNANESCAALPTVLDLAAAGGIELAQASDMVTDSMSALGLEMDELSGFADEMAVTSQKSNTSVSQLGNAILAVGANARILAGDTNELMTELGILADAGKKGAEGGTALARVIKNLSTPVSNAKKELEALGVECYDAEGNFRNMQDIFKDLKAAMSDFTEEEKQAALSEIFDTAALSSAKILLEQCGDRFDELSGYISEADGAASQMADTMSDTLAGDVTILQSSLEGLANTAYDEFAGTMRESVQSVTEDVGVLNESLKNGELSESVDKIAESFSDGLAATMKFVAEDAIPALIKGFTLVADHGNEIISVAKGIAVAFAGWKIAGIVDGLTASIAANVIAVQAMQAANTSASISTLALAGNLSAAQIASALFTGNISLATAAQAAFNLVCSANPILLVTAALAGLVTGIGLFINALEDGEEEMNEYQKEMENIRSSGEKIVKTSEKDIAVLKRKSERYEELRQRYASLNKKEMAEFLSLAEELQDVLPEGTVLVDEQTGAYNSLADSIDKVIEKMRMQALLNAKKSEYETAVAQNYDIDAKLNHANFAWENDEDGSAIIDTWKAIALSDDPLDAQRAFIQQYFIDEYGMTYDSMMEAKKENEKIIEDYERLYQENAYNEDSSSHPAENGSGETIGDTSSDKKLSREQARIDAEEAESKKRTKRAQMSEKEKNEALKKLADEWDAAVHKRQTGEIASDEALYAEKLRIWKKYGDESRQDMWRYQEDLVRDEKKIAEDRKKNTEDTDDLTALSKAWAEANHKRKTGEIASDEELYQVKKELWKKYGDSSREDMWGYHEDILDMEKEFSEKTEQQKYDEWEQIEKLENLGLLTSEQAYEKRKEWIEKYCPEYSDEWYSYYKTVYDYEKDFSEKQLADRKAHLNEELNAVKNNVNDILSKYKSAYSEIESDISSYKSKLLGAAGSVFEVTETENEDGSKTKTFKVNDIKAQIETMKKYHEALLKMKNDGAPQSLISEMMNLDPEEGLQMAQFIIDSGDLENISELYKQRDKIAQEMAEEFYQPEIDELNSDTVSKITAEYESLPAEFYDIGKNAIEQLYIGMNEASGDISGILENNFDGLEKDASSGIDNMSPEKSVLNLDPGDIGKIADSAADIFKGAEKIFDAASSLENASLNADKNSEINAVSEISKNITNDITKISGEISTNFTKMISAIKNIKVTNNTYSQLTLDGRVINEHVDAHINELGRMTDE